MPIELVISPILRPISRVQAQFLGISKDSEHFVPTVVELDHSKAKTFSIRKDFGTGSKVFSVYDDADGRVPSQESRLLWMNRSRAVKGAYKMYRQGEELPVATLRAARTSNVLMIKSPDGDMRELGWHVVSYKNDALDQYRTFQLKDGYFYQWTTSTHFLERVKNYGEKEAEVRERIAHVRTHPGNKGFDLELDMSQDVDFQMVIATALICYIEAWNTYRGYGGIYKAKQHMPAFFWQRS